MIGLQNIFLISVMKVIDTNIVICVSLQTPTFADTGRKKAVDKKRAQRTKTVRLLGKGSFSLLPGDHTFFVQEMNHIL